MISVSILINGQPIYTRSAVNVTHPEMADGKSAVYECDEGTVIEHDIEDGAVVLAKKLLDTIKEVK